MERGNKEGLLKKIEEIEKNRKKMTFERYVSGDILDKIEHMCTKGSHARAAPSC